LAENRACCRSNIHREKRSAEKAERFLYNDDSASVLPVISAEYHPAGLAARNQTKPNKNSLLFLTSA
jgi:hypothetical protein